MSAELEITGLGKAACNVRMAALEELDAIWKDPENGLQWRCLFTLPPWLRSWWSSFGGGGKPHLVAVADRNDLIGLAPLRIHGQEAALLGGPDVCDYLDVIAVPGRQSDFARYLLSYLGKGGIRKLSFNGIREGGVVATDVIPLARALGWDIQWEKEDVSYAVKLPRTWDSFLSQLKGKQRHELRRKLRRLNEAGDVRFRLFDSVEDAGTAIDIFIDLFRASRPDKAAFMTGRMAGFFRSLASAFSRYRILKLGILELSAKPVSTVMCFDYGSTRYLYNSGYDPHFQSLSVGLMAKVLSIRDAVENGIPVYDFLKGAEDYKKRLGGAPSEIYRCAISLP